MPRKDLRLTEILPANNALSVSLWNILFHSEPTMQRRT
jgi:hypothetical protein